MSGRESKKEQYIKVKENEMSDFQQWRHSYKAQDLFEVAKTTFNTPKKLSPTGARSQRYASTRATSPMRTSPLEAQTDRLEFSLRSRAKPSFVKHRSESQNDGRVRFGNDDSSNKTGNKSIASLLRRINDEPVRGEGTLRLGTFLMSKDQHQYRLGLQSYLNQKHYIVNRRRQRTNIDF